MKAIKFIIIGIACLALAACASTQHGTKSYFQKPTKNQAVLIKQIRDEGVHVFQIGDTLRLVLFSDLFFDKNTTHIDRRYEQALVDIAALLKNYPRQQITVSAHSDNVGTRLAQRKATQDQAEQIASYLWAQGIPKNRLHLIGKGNKDTVASDHTVFGSASNRRVEINIG